MRKILSIAIALAAISSAAVSAGTLVNVKERDVLKCGVSLGLAGFSVPDDAGMCKGLDVDYCRAIATAVIGDPTKV